MVVARGATLAAALLLPVTGEVRAQGPCDTHLPRLLGAQATFIPQRLNPFAATYSGPMSLKADGDFQMSQSYGAYGGWCAMAGLEAYVDVEMVRGNGVSHASGVASVPNGDVIRQGSADLGDGPYLARAFVRWSIGLGGDERDTASRAMDALPVIRPANRLEITAGKYGASDLFDLNRYANSTRTQFLTWGLFQNTAWDYAADTRGYTNGVTVSWITPGWEFRVGSFQMPLQANGNVFDGDIVNARGDNVELTINGPEDVVVRVLAFMNHARMGRYAVVLATTRPDVTPDIVADDAAGRTKSGFGINLELPLADSGETGAFARFGWNDGNNESFAFTESEEVLSGGLQWSGAHWHRVADRFAVAFVANGIHELHREYLARGGRGFLLGDGALTYGPETVWEAYYRVQLGPYVQVSPDVQVIVNPGYNQARGPATVLTLRGSFRY